MRTTIAKNHKATHSDASKAFFNKDATGSFFSKSKETEAPFFTSSKIQAKLNIGQAGDPYEKEADAMAEQVVSQSSSVNTTPKVIQRKCDACEDKEQIQEKKETDPIIHKKPIFESAGKSKEETLQAKSTQNHIQLSPDLESTLHSTNGKGSPLSKDTRTEMETGFGANFSNVRIHNDAQAAQMNKDLGARAFTHGADIYFNQGQFNNSSKEGKKLLAHELTHTIQQGSVATNHPTVMKSNGLSGTNIIQRNDAAFEGGSGLSTALTSGTMAADAIMGTTVTADNCRGLFGCNVGFNFAKAYKGIYPYAAAGRDVKGVYAKIESVYDHDICGSCDQIRLIQTVRSITKGTSGNIETDDPGNATRRERSGWSDPSAASRGWRIDTVSSETRPFYDTSPGFDSQIGSPSQPAILWDAPGVWDTDTNAGREFQTFLVCETGTGDRKTIAGVNWGFYINSSGTINFRPATPIATCGASQELQDASARWDAIAGNQATGIDFATESPVDHEGTRSILWFDHDSMSLRNDSTIDSNTHYAIANKRIRQHILATMPYTQIIIHGYASQDGAAGYNMDLSERRAIVIRDRLISEGIPANMLVIQKHGEDTTHTPDDLNRRVEIETTKFLGPVLPPHLQPGGGMLGPLGPGP
ncbi:eCIS core domain-containing protein [Aquimarina sp. 2304DJ70-9]|uniref:eCIS core domain-containing protein n=1 Tax=Aquimarina penaris TaxID=3231044 RepID=UPI003462F4A0